MRVSTTLILLLILFSSILNAQICNESIEAVAPDSRYTDSADGTVTDNVTGLMWKKCSEGYCTGTATIYTWQAALQIPINVNTNGGFAGYTDWRLPNIKELNSLVEERCAAPAINSTLFPNTPLTYYWSSSPAADIFSKNAWAVRFYHGFDYDNPRDYEFSVRLVRSGQ